MCEHLFVSEGLLIFPEVDQFHPAILHLLELWEKTPDKNISYSMSMGLTI